MAEESAARPAATTAIDHAGTSTGDPRRPSARVDPFALPPSTTSQFLLLSVLTLAAAAFSFDQILGGPTRWEDRYTACANASDRAGATEAPLTVTRQYVDCFVAANLVRTGTALAATAAVGVLLLLAALAHAALLIRRQGLFRLDPAEFPAASAIIRECLREAGPAREPDIYLEPFGADLGGRGFGWPRPRIRLALGLVDGRHDHLLRAVVRHELAHVRNRDLGLTAVAIVVPTVFVAAVALPLLVDAAAVPGQFMPTAARFAGLFLVLILVRAAVFRAREHHADLRASTVAAAGIRFDRRAFPDVGSADRPGRPGARWYRRARSLLRAHPSTDRRAAVVDQPEPVLRASFAEAVAAGITAAVSFCYLRNLLIGLMQGSIAYAGFAAGVIVGLLVAAVSGMSMWRAALFSLALGRPLPTGVRPGLGLAVGLLAGELLVPPSMSAWPGLVLGRPHLALLTAAVLATGCAIYLRWSASTAAAWLAASGAASLRATARRGALVGALVFGTAYAVWFGAVLAVATQGTFLALVIGLAPANGFALVPLLLAAAYPLLAGARAAGPWSVPREVYLDRPRRSRLPVGRSRLLLVLLPGTVLATAFVAVDSIFVHGALIPLVNLAGAAPVEGTVPQTGVAQLLSLGALFLAAELLVVLVVAALTGRARVRATFSHAFCAGALTGTLLSYAIFAYPIALVCRADCEPVTLGGGIGAAVTLSTLMALGTAITTWSFGAVHAAVRRRRRPLDGHLPDGQRSRAGWRTRVLAWFAAVVAVVFLAPVAFATLVSTGAIRSDSSFVPWRTFAAPFEPHPSTPAAVCHAYMRYTREATGVLPDYAEPLRIGRAAQVSGAPGLFSIGATMEQAILTGDIATLALTQRALYPICSRYPDQP